MADNWYYIINGVEHGPVTLTRLEELAQCEQLGPSALVRRGELADWIPAAKVKGLFRPRTPSKQPGPPPGPPPVPPPILVSSSDRLSNPIEPPLPPNDGYKSPQTLETLIAAFEKSKTFAKRFAATAQSAAKLTAKQAERTKIQNVSLPQAFMALGRHVYSANELRSDFAAEFEGLDELYAKIETLETQAKTRPSGEKMTDKAKAAAASTKDRAEAQALRLQIARMKAKLGRAAYEKYGKGLDALEVIASIEQLLARSDALSEEIDELSQRSEGQLITPQRLAVGGIVTLVVVVAVVGVSLFHGGSAVPEHPVVQSYDLPSADLSFDIGTNREPGESSETALVQGVRAFQSFAENPHRSADSARFISKPLAITGQTISVVDLDEGTRLDLDVSSLGQRAMCWFRGESAKQVWAADEVRLHVLGTYKGISNVGGLELTDCQLVTASELAATMQAVTQPPTTTQAINSTARTFQARIGTALETPVWIHRNFNPSIQDLRCRATNDQLVLDFDVDTDLWAINGNKVGWRLPLFIRLADRNGNILTHFTTVEGFTVFPEVYMSWNEKYKRAVRGRMPADMLAKTKCELLKAQGNRLVYTVNVRDLRDAAIAEVGFYQEP